MGYVEKNLLEGEEIIYKAHKHWKLFMSPVLIFFIGIGSILIPVIIKTGLAQDKMDDQMIRLALLFCGLGFIALSGFIFFVKFLQYKSSEYVLTNKRIIVKQGFIKRNTFELLNKKVEGIGVSQGLLDRLLNCGTIVITGTGEGKQIYHDISNPVEFRKKVQEQNTK